MNKWGKIATAAALLATAGCGASEAATNTATVTKTVTVTASPSSDTTQRDTDAQFDYEIRRSLGGFDGDMTALRAEAQGICKSIPTISLNYLVALEATGLKEKVGGTSDWDSASALTFISIAKSNYCNADDIPGTV